MNKDDNKIKEWNSLVFFPSLNVVKPESLAKNKEQVCDIRIFAKLSIKENKG